MQVVDLTNSTVDSAEVDDIEVFRRTSLWHNLVYKNMVRHLLPVLTSQVVNTQDAEHQTRLTFDRFRHLSKISNAGSVKVTQKISGCNNLVAPHAAPTQQRCGKGDKI